MRYFANVGFNSVIDIMGVFNATGAYKAPLLKNNNALLG